MWDAEMRGDVRFGAIEECVVGGQELLFAGHAVAIRQSVIIEICTPHWGSPSSTFLSCGRSWALQTFPNRSQKEKEKHTKTEGSFPRYPDPDRHPLVLCVICQNCSGSW